MKQGLNFILSVNVGVSNMNTVNKIEFKFVQDDVVRVVEYPSDDAVLDDDGSTINILWTKAETYRFKAGKVKLDTRITLNGTIYQPETEITSFNMSPTLFESNE